MGLSPRGAGNVDAILEKINAAVEERAKQNNTNIDLGTSENWLIRDELMKICKDAIQNCMVAKVRATGFPTGSRTLPPPLSFGGELYISSTRVN